MAVAAMSQETRSQQHAIFVTEELERALPQSAATGAATAEGPIASACCRCCSPTLCGSQGDHNRNLPEVAAAAVSRGGGAGQSRAAATGRGSFSCRQPTCRLGGHQGSTPSGLAVVDSMCLRRASITGAEVQSTPLGCYPSAGLRQVATTGTFLEWP